MTSDSEEFLWYSGEIDKFRARCNRAWAEYSEARQQLDRLESERATIFRRMIAAQTAGQDGKSCT